MILMKLHQHEKKKKTTPAYQRKESRKVMRLLNCIDYELKHHFNVIYLYYVEIYDDELPLI